MLEKFLSTKFIIIFALMYGFVFAVATPYVVSTTIPADYPEDIAFFGYPVSFIGQEIQEEDLEGEPPYKLKADMSGAVYTEVYVGAFLVNFLCFIIFIGVFLFIVRYLYNKGKSGNGVMFTASRRLRR